MSKTAEQILKELSEPFDPGEVKFKPAVVSGNRAMALAYVDARVIQDRLDDVLGVEGWQDDYECREDGSVICRLSIRIGGEWIKKVDVGGPSEQPDGGDRLKAAFSDSLKRAAVKFGVGRYLYRTPQQWVDYDPQKRCFKTTPTLPAAFQPAKPTVAQPAKKPQPSKGEEAMLFVNKMDREWSALGWFKSGELIKDIKEQFPGNCAEWAEEAVKQVGAALRKVQEANLKKAKEPETWDDLHAQIREVQERFKGKAAADTFKNGILMAASAAHFPKEPKDWKPEQIKVAAGWLQGMVEEAEEKVGEEAA
jgi:hypothetical protein